MILCTGEAVIDMIRSKIDGNEVYKPIPGGCTYNTSIAIARLGVPVSFFGRISKNFFGEIQINRLIQNNVNTDLIIRCDKNPILAFIKTEKNKDPEYTFYEEGTADKLLTVQELPVLSSDINCIVFGSVSLAMEPIGSTIEELVLKESKNRITSFDPNIRPAMIKDRDSYLKRFEKLAPASTIVKISIEDYEYLESNPNPKNALEKLINMGTRLAIITLRKDGAMALLKKDNGKIISARVPGEKISEVADTVGAGDSFMGAFLAHLDKKDLLSINSISAISETDLQEALTFANKVAAFVCTKTGCEPPRFGEGYSYYKKGHR